MQDFVGETLDLPLDQRLEASLAAVVFAVAAGANVARVQDVRASVRVVRFDRGHPRLPPPVVTRRGLA
jgi:dihydropteroate synthase